MISIRSSLADLDRAVQEKAEVVDCYNSAIRNVAQYTIEFTPEVAERHPKYLNELAECVNSGDPDTLGESRATFRGLLRDYGDKAAEYLSEMRAELVGTTSALGEILEAFTKPTATARFCCAARWRIFRNIA